MFLKKPKQTTCCYIRSLKKKKMFDTMLEIVFYTMLEILAKKKRRLL
jgi:hypothetical protein